jgi:hypothetical protein
VGVQVEISKQGHFGHVVQQFAIDVDVEHQGRERVLGQGLGLLVDRSSLPHIADRIVP